MLRTKASPISDWRDVEFTPKGRKNPVGWASVTPGRMIYNVRIDPLKRGRGFGKQMMAEIIEKFGRPLRLDVRKDNVVALRCYKAVGFEVVKPKGEHSQFYLDSFLYMEIK